MLHCNELGSVIYQNPCIETPVVQQSFQGHPFRTFTNLQVTILNIRTGNHNHDNYVYTKPQSNALITLYSENVPVQNAFYSVVGVTSRQTTFSNAHSQSTFPLSTNTQIQPLITTHLNPNRKWAEEPLSMPNMLLRS